MKPVIKASTITQKDYCCWLWGFKISCFSDSAEASELDKVKQTTAEQQAKSEQRRMKFQAQDSVLAESLTYD